MTKFELVFGKGEFEEMVLSTCRQYTDAKRRKRFRLVHILHPQKWTEIVATKMYGEHTIKHGYGFERSHINVDRTGGFTGHCKCGSKLTCTILEHEESSQLVIIACMATDGSGECGKRQLRAHTRKKLVRAMEGVSTELFRSQLTDKLMDDDTSDEPPNLYTAKVLRKARFQARKAQFRHPDTIEGLKILKKSFDGQIREITDMPRKVHYWSDKQIKLNNELSKKEHLQISIDATGSIVHKIKRGDDQSPHIFLYVGLITPTTNVASFVAFSMFSERQDMLTIWEWLMRWTESGATPPKEVVCDSSKALLNACCLAFCDVKSIGEYANECFSPDLPKCYIRIDVAQYIKNWANFLKTETKTVKRFYMFAIGSLILCQSIADAEKMIKSLLITLLTD